MKDRQGRVAAAMVAFSLVAGAAGQLHAIETLDDASLATAEVSLPEQLPFAKKGQILIMATPKADLLKATHEGPPVERKSRNHVRMTVVAP